MTRTIRLLPAALMLGALAAPVTAQVKDGFRDLKWGSAPLPDMIEVGRKANMTLYQRDKEDKRALGRDNTRITYSYYQGSLCRVTLEWAFLDDQASAAILKTLQEEWGKPIKLQELGYMVGGDWISNNGSTTGSLYAINDPQTKEVDWYSSVMLTHKPCFEAAVRNNNL